VDDLEEDLPWTPRFLPTSHRHGSAPFRAFVQVEGDPPRPRRRERAAGGPPTRLRTEASQASPMAGEGSVAIGGEAGRGWYRAASGMARGVTAPGHLRGGALGDAGGSSESRDASDEGHQAWRSDLAKAMWSQSRYGGHARRAEQLKTVGARRGAPTPMKRSR
jgi:hypothetical protein